ncbi:hypothetical protein ACFPES_19255 [Paenibacillus sp. GCM10023248]|uniref:hypothetical protein n=1 Tax=Bacillales TaxID=1385 RepID=UPI0023797450|nr:MULTISPECIES: hypothetical protein [Bacillales]MDD9269189.1 hypothetical protein [Paenibacillus sp. MAHUQ-63]MDR6880591.1 hypothetical protein [Bacillus sp. 3255]
MKSITLGYERNAAPRVAFGISQLRMALQDCGYTVHEADTSWTWDSYRAHPGLKIYIGNRQEAELVQQLEQRDVLLYHTTAPEGEGFYLATCPGSLTVISGGSDSGVLYGCMELARRIRDAQKLPSDIAYGDGPRFALRGPAIGLQKTTVEPPRQTYEYPITPERFPWFYDRDLWLDFLDMMVQERCNVVYIWSGHPFSSLVKLADYPEAQEVTDEELALNAETFRWLTEEADRRGIWVVLKFYNIHIPLPFAEKHGLKLHQPKPLPLTSDYYKKSITAFVQSFPNAGLMVCLGEALQGQIYGVEWFNETILAGLLEGLKNSNVKEKPPIILRSHAIEPQKVIEAALPLYPNLYTEAKYNGESLTTYTPRGKWQETHNRLGSLQTIHIVNVHILANLEPFRYGAPSFIQKCMQAAKYRLKANGLHLYPLFFWDWPYAPDRAEKRLRQLDRDWIWFASWFRYAWNPDRDPEAERHYWIETLGSRYGSREAGEAILDAYEASGECAPKLLRRFGITEGNRQTMSLGMTMSQLTNPERHMPWPDLWESQSPQGERLEDYVVKELSGQPHVGETPADIIGDAQRHAQEALEAIERARSFVAHNEDEYERLAGDIAAIHHMVQAYAHKVEAAIRILTYKHTVKGEYHQRLDLLEEAAAELEGSLDSYKKLTALTEQTYLFANSMQTPQRKVPIRGGMDYRHWTACLPLYEAELNAFRTHLQELKAGSLPAALRNLKAPIVRYDEAPFKLLSDHAEVYRVEKGAEVFTDGDIQIVGIAEELNGLSGIRFSQRQAGLQGLAVEIELQQPSKVLVGYFNNKDEQWLQVPSLEENTHADDRGGYAPVLRKGLRLYAYPSVNMHAFLYEAGRHVLDFGKGAFLILGVVPADQEMRVRDVEHKNDGVDTLDWLYE